MTLTSEKAPPGRRKKGLHNDKIMGRSLCYENKVIHIIHRFFHRQKRKNPLQIQGLQGVFENQQGFSQ